ncbi:MAG: c-type cytochrome [Chloroflexi bacterium]|nr:c-type cytochrome [Chloroflexota bacterium]
MHGPGSEEFRGVDSQDRGCLNDGRRRRTSRSPSRVILGRTVYNEVACNYCHSINGVGGTIGPDLTAVGGKLSQDQIEAYLRNPHAMIPASLHPKLQFTEQEVRGLSTYLSTLGARVSYSEMAPALYRTHCASCHKLDGEGGTAGPDLSGIGSRRPLNFIEAFTIDPRSVVSGTRMPAFKNVLTEAQIRDIAAYLYSQKGGPAAPVR